MRKTMIIGLIACVIIAGVLGYTSLRNTQIQAEIKALDLVGVPMDVAKRHIWIVKHAPEVPTDPNYIPVHIMYRRSQSDDWHLMGSGTILTKYTNYFVSAYHVFAGQPGQFGCRRISRAEFNGTEPILPIIRVGRGTNGDDSIIGEYRREDLSFPEISVPESDSVFKEFTNGIFKGESYPAKIHLLTYPEKTLKGAFWIEVKPGTKYIFFQWDVKPGESGTGGKIEHEPPGYFLVAVRHVLVDDVDMTRRLGIPNRVYYGVGHLIKIQ